MYLYLYLMKKYVFEPSPDCDTVLARVRLAILQGNSMPNENSFVPYQNKRDELSVQDGCILRGSRLVQRKGTRIGSASSRAPWYLQDAKFSKGVCLVAGNR